MRQDLQAKLDRALDAMCREIDPDHGLLRKLLSAGVLSAEQIESCKEKPTRTSRVEEMVRCLRLTENSVYEKFRQILCEYGYRQFVNEHLPPAEGREPKLKESTTNPQDRKSRESDVLIRNQLHAQKMTRQLPRSLTAAFDGKRSLLRKRMITNGLLDELRDMDLITADDISNIQLMIRTSEEKISELMTAVERRSNSKVHEFFTALHNSGQDGVLEDVFKFKWQPNGEFIAMDVVEPNVATDLHDGVFRERNVAATVGEEFAPTVAKEYDKKRRTEDEKYLHDGVFRERNVAATVGQEFAPTVGKEYDKKRRTEDEKWRPRSITLWHLCYVAAPIVVLVAGVGYMKVSAMEKPIMDPMSSQQGSQPGEQSKEQNLFRAAFKNCRAKLVSDIDIEHELLLHMRDKGVLTGDHVADIKSHKIPSAMVGRMLDLLERRDNAHFKGFCDALIDSDQKSIVDRYLRAYYPKEN